MRFKRPYIATLDEVIITKQGETAIIEYKEPSIYTTQLKLGLEIHNMTDQNILDCHNNCISTQLEFMKNYKHIAIEILPGNPQIEYFAPGGYWIARGDVLRCLIDNNKKGETTIWIDDQEFEMAEFGKLLSVFTGWGMRVIIVPEDETCQGATVEIKDPDHKQEGSTALSTAFISTKEH